jgi:membrane protein YdbS with pleckstrin-like domain
VSRSQIATDAHPEPTRRLPAHARALWRLQAAIRWVGLAIAARIVSSTVGDELPDPLPLLLWIVPALGLITDLAVSDVRWRRWRYEIRDEEIDLRRGALTVTRTLVPMARIQHVDTHRGVLERFYDVATVVVHTAAGATSIPALRVREAAEVRDRIATLTRTADEL